LLRRILTAIVLVPLAVIMIAFAMANRQPIMVSFDPFSASEPAAAITLPLFALIIILLIIGVVVGGAASWFRQGKWRGAARRFERDLQKLREKVHALEGTAANPEGPPGEAPRRLRLRPPAR